jgi:hypothetical protein
MKTLNNFKDEVAKEKGFDKFDITIIIFPQIIIELAAERYAEYMAVRFQDWIMEGNGFIKDTQAQKLHTDLELYKIFKEQNK